MTIANALDTATLDNISIAVNFTDEAGNAVRATSDSNDATARFFMRVDSVKSIDRIDVPVRADATPARAGRISGCQAQGVATGP